MRENFGESPRSNPEENKELEESKRPEDKEKKSDFKEGIGTIREQIEEGAKTFQGIMDISIDKMEKLWDNLDAASETKEFSELKKYFVEMFKIYGGMAKELSNEGIKGIKTQFQIIGDKMQELNDLIEKSKEKKERGREQEKK